MDGTTTTTPPGTPGGNNDPATVTGSSPSGDSPSPPKGTYPPRHSVPPLTS